MVAVEESKLSEPSPHERFLQELLASQGALRAFILTLATEREFAEETLQETNLAIIRKEAEFTPGTDFRAWACSQAFFQVLSGRKRRSRQKLVFDDELVQVLAQEALPEVQHQDARQAALRYCLSLLSPPQREMLERRYAGESVQNIATQSGRTEAVISQTLYRLRKNLKDCIGRRMAGELST